MNFLCAVSSRFPENYEIGLRAGVWGVEERYREKIEQTSVGDPLVFLVGGEFRSIHLIESDVYYDTGPLWPEKDGSVFPFRIRISPPTHKGSASVDRLVSEISFMRDKKKWQGTVQGPHGVFNARLTDQDLDVIRAALHPYRELDAAPRRQEPERPRIALHIFEEQVRTAVSEMLEELDLVRADDSQAVEENGGAAGFSVVAEDQRTGASVLLVVDAGASSSDLILQTLRQISALRQDLPRNRDVRGLILTDLLRDELRLVINEIPNIEVRTYRLRFDLDPDPDNAVGNNGWNAA